MSMKVLIVLLLFGVQLLSGQTVSKLEFENGTEVYQIIELQNNTMEFVNPLKKQPTLREIIFYKVVEKPYIEKNDELEVVTKEKEKPRKPDFDETIRPFTNGHGLQFPTWGSQDENTEHRNAPEKEKNVNKNSNSTRNDSNQNHENDDQIYDNKDNNDDDKNNDKKSHIHKDEDDDDDKSNVKKPNIDKDDDDDDDEDDKDANRKHSNYDGKIEDDDNSKDDENDIGVKKKHSNDDSLIEDEDSSKDDDDSSGGEKTVENTKRDDKKIVEDKGKGEEVNKEEDEKTREAKFYEEEINLAKKLRSELLNSTKEKYHTIERNNQNATHERKKREVSYENVPEAPKLPELDVQAFPTYIQRMLASRPTFRNTQDSVKVRSNYNADLFHKMDGVLSNNMPKTYGFKYSNDRSESWNDLYKTQDNRENVIAPTFKDLSGSQTNNPYEKISEPDIELRNNFISDEEQTTNTKETLSKNKNEIEHHTKNIYSSTSVINNNVDKNQRSVKINNEKPNIDTDNLDKSSGIDMKDKLITMLQNIDNKLTNGKPPKTYGMSIKGAEVQTWNDISVTPTVTKYENANKENIVENRPNKADNLNNAMNRLNLDFREDADSYDNAHKEKLILTKSYGVDQTNDAEEANINTSYDNINNRLGKYGEKPVTNIDNTLSENTSEISENKLENKSNTVNKKHTNILQNYINPLNYNEANSDNDDEGIILNKNKTENKPKKPKENEADDSMSPDDDINNYDQEFDQIPEPTNKVANNVLETPTDKPFDVDTSDEIYDPKDNYNEFKNSQYVLSTTERLTEEPEVTKENLLIVNEDLKLKMEKSFDNVINQFPKLKQIELTGTKAVDNLNNLDDDNNKKPMKPNTYGMHLEGDHGYIWNELTNPGKVTYVGNLNKINEIKPNINHESTTMKIVENKVENHTEPPKPTTNENKEITTKQPVVTTTENQNTVDEENKSVTEIPIENELNEKKNCICNTDNVNEDNNVDSSNKNETETLKLSLDELLKNDEFWKWLSNWTSTYMEVLNEQVETLVKNEVANQLKQINDDKNNTKVNDCNKFNEGNKTNNTIDDDVDKQSDGNKYNTTESSKINENNSNNSTTSGSKEEKSNIAALEPCETNNVTDTTTEKNNSEFISKENELGKENNITDQDMNKGKNNSLPVNIKSNTIYGNAIGNDHVTNIFIFYPSVDSNKTLEKIESTTNQTHSEISAFDEKPANITIDERFGVSEESKDTDDTVSKTKDLANGQNNTSSTESSQQNKGDTTENLETTLKTEEELKNKTKTELNGTSDNGDFNTKQIDKTETTTGMRIKNDDGTTPISTNSVTVSKTEKNDSTTEKLTTTNSVSDKSDSTTDKTEKSDSKTEKPETALKDSGSTTENSDTATEKSDSTTEKTDSKDTSTEKSADS